MEVIVIAIACMFTSSHAYQRDLVCDRQQTTPVWLYLPNQVDYVRLFMLGGLVLCRALPLGFAALYLTWWALDGVDGYLARRFNQVSAFGACLDVIIDNIGRIVWSLALEAPFGVFVPCLEWLTFAASQVCVCGGMGDKLRECYSVTICTTRQAKNVAGDAR